LLINFIYGWRCAKQNELANLVGLANRLLLPGMRTTQWEGSCYWILILNVKRFQP